MATLALRSRREQKCIRPGSHPEHSNETDRDRTVTMNDSNGLTLLYNMLDEKEEKRKGEKKEEDKQEVDKKKEEKKKEKEKKLKKEQQQEGEDEKKEDEKNEEEKWDYKK